MKVLSQGEGESFPLDRCLLMGDPLFPEVRQFIDGSWRVYYQDQQIAQHEATQLREPLRTLKRSKTRVKAASPYSWVYAASASPYAP
jgi:hypothetical protein